MRQIETPFKPNRTKLTSTHLPRNTKLLPVEVLRPVDDGLVHALDGGAQRADDDDGVQHARVLPLVGQLAVEHPPLRVRQLPHRVVLVHVARDDGAQPERPHVRRALDPVPRAERLPALRQLRRREPVQRVLELRRRLEALPRRCVQAVVADDGGSFHLRA